MKHLGKKGKFGELNEEQKIVGEESMAKQNYFYRFENVAVSCFCPMILESFINSYCNFYQNFNVIYFIVLSHLSGIFHFLQFNEQTKTLHFKIRPFFLSSLLSRSKNYPRKSHWVSSQVIRTSSFPTFSLILKKRRTADMPVYCLLPQFSLCDSKVLHGERQKLTYSMPKHELS